MTAQFKKIRRVSLADNTLRISRDARGAMERGRAS